MSSKFTAAQRAEIMAQSRRNVAHLAAKPNGGGAQTNKYIEQDVASTQTELVSLRSDLAALQAHVEVLARTLASLVEDVTDTRSFVRKGLPAVQAPQASDGVVWWEWVTAHVDARLAELSDVVAEAVGHIADRVREEFDERASAEKRELELLRRELTVLREEVGLEHALKDLRSSVVKAQRAVPQVPAIEARLRGEALIAKTDTDRELAELRKKLKDAQRTIHSLQVRQAGLSRDLKRGLDEGLEVEWEASSSYARMVIRPSIHPDAAKTLREFAGRVIDGPIIQH